MFRAWGAKDVEARDFIPWDRSRQDHQGRLRKIGEDVSPDAAAAAFRLALGAAGQFVQTEPAATAETIDGEQ